MDKDTLDRMDRIWKAVAATDVDVAVIKHRQDDFAEDIKRLEKRLNGCNGGSGNGNGPRNRRVQKYAVAGGGGIAGIVIVLETLMNYL